MFKIGDFSKIANVPITQLRYYDDIGIFTPTHTDNMTSYRYYSIEQMPRLNRILALRNLGMSLEQIKRMLDDTVSSEEIRGMFILRKAQIEDAVREEIMRLKAVEYRLRQIENEGSLSQYDVVLKTIPDQPMFSIRKQAQEWEWVLNLFADVQRQLGAGDASRFKGVRAALIHNAPTNETDGYDVEVGYIGDESMTEKIANQFDLSLRTVTGGEVATLVHHGDDESNGYYIVANWVERNGYQIDGAIREIYWQLSQNFESADAVVEFQFPVIR